MSNAATPREKAAIQGALEKAKPGRKATVAAVPVDANLDQNALTMASVAADQMALVQASYSHGRDLVNQLLGQAQAFQAAGNLLQTFGVSKLAIVKENKLYQQLSGMKTPNGLELKGTWTEFCQLLGMSDEKANQDIANLNAFGEEALEQMQRIGIGYRELRQYRKLPEDQRAALIEVAKKGDKESFVELAEEIISKHAKEKETLAAQVEEAAASLEAKDKVLKAKSQRLNELEEEKSRKTKFVPRPGSVARNQAEATLLKEVFTQSVRINSRMRALFEGADAALGEGADASEAVQQAVRSSVQYLAQQFADMAREFAITIDLDERVDAPWTAEDEAALATLEARNEAASGRAK
ncbi:hypothetical protein [Acidovorax sp. ACV01]|uniref:hypothetical protein n=1 Tax=Acidovorax sp. ACV01 TaxID=2769311 RepID=UPI00177A8B32|nr:hypothetical protein [Acidovorax sp. ACV01]MBD9395750.1 hypothetical protein [Acidovorax sp. ACV01]